MKKRIVSLGILLAIHLLSSANANEIYQVKVRQVDSTIKLSGTVEAVNKGTLSAQTSGQIVAVNVDVNDHVEKGDVLLEISAKQHSAVLNAAIAQLNSSNAQSKLAQAQVKRYRDLFPAGAISKERLDEAEAEARSVRAAVKAATASVNQAKESLGYTQITAPYTGIITQRFVELGETVSAGSKLITGFSLSPLRVVTEVPQKYHRDVRTHEQFTLTDQNGNIFFTHEVKKFNYANSESRAFKVRLELMNEQEQLYPGSWITVTFAHSQRSLLVIPKSAVIQRGELSMVYRKIGKKIQMNPVRLGQVQGDFIEVLSGIEDGDNIIHNIADYRATLK